MQTNSTRETYWRYDVGVRTFLEEEYDIIWDLLWGKYGKINRRKRKDTEPDDKGEKSVTNIVLDLKI